MILLSDHIIDPQSSTALSRVRRDHTHGAAVSERSISHNYSCDETVVDREYRCIPSADWLCLWISSLSMLWLCRLGVRWLSLSNDHWVSLSTAVCSVSVWVWVSCSFESGVHSLTLLCRPAYRSDWQTDRDMAYIHFTVSRISLSSSRRIPAFFKN